VTADKGLCGAFNTNLIRQTLHYLKEHGTENVDIFVVGRKGRDFFKRYGAQLSKEYLAIFNALSSTHADLITSDVVDAYLNGKYVTVDVLYNEFKSVIAQKLVVKQLLPLQAVDQGEVNRWPDFEYEPSQKQLLEELIPRFLKSQVFRVLLESSAAELGARMSAMDSATKNAKELMSGLTLKMNRTRQATITNEILEVVSGAEVLK
jgi:F-type H+-transporting ATPase subunit gamma